MENLIDVLEKESSEYEELLKLSQRKTPIIVSGNLENLQKITDEEQVQVSRVNQLEKKRIEITADIANVLNKDVTTLKLSNLIDMLANRPVEQKALAQAHDRLQVSVRELQRVNEQNRELIADALEMIEFEMNLMQAMKTAPQTANYNRGAYSAGNTMGVSSHGFDTKQ
ncbi:MAG: flagellar protein FlgN [Lachnospiraceae bacterium]|nr:flagellar protein FlgN [Lachnospiraceae bacterium]